MAQNIFICIAFFEFPLNFLLSDQLFHRRLHFANLKKFQRVVCITHQTKQNALTNNVKRNKKLQNITRMKKQKHRLNTQDYVC